MLPGPTSKSLLAATALVAAAVLLFPALPAAQSLRPDTPPEIFPLAEVRPGMTGYVRTIFAGDRIEQVELEVLGILPNLLGPRQDIILVKLRGELVEHTGVAGGMSGSPVYLEGKLAGALSLRFGVFSKEPLAGVTPIESMLGVGVAPAATGEVAASGRYPVPAEFVETLGLGAGAFLTPIPTPTVFSGFHPAALPPFAGQLLSQGMVATHGGTAPAQPDDAEIAPGDMASMVLVSGDVSIQASCTVSAVIGDRVLVCGHPVLGFGDVAMPMARGRVVTTLASSMASTKIVNAGGVIGTFTDDRLTAVAGRLGPPPRMIPMELETVTPAGSQRFSLELVEHAKLTPLLVSLATFNGLVSNTVYGEGLSFQLTGEIQIAGQKPVTLENMFAPTDAPLPDALFVVSAVQSVFTRIFTNPYQPARIERIRLRVEAAPERRLAVIDSAWSEKSEVSPGEEIHIKVLLRPWRGAPFLREVPITIPAQAARGPVRILISDSDTLNRLGRFFAFSPVSRLASLEQLITLLNRERRNNRLYVTLLQPNPTLLLEDKELPNAPGSHINVLDHRRSTGSSLLLRESIAGEWSVRLDQVISGQHVLTITVK
jgi:hypothetical protein